MDAPTTEPFVPAEFVVPRSVTAGRLHLVVLGPEHNAQDYAAWTSSMEHIRRTPGFENSRWPRPMSLEENHGDLVAHARDFEERTGFTYTVLVDGEVAGCVYIYPVADAPGEASVRSWMRADHADLDQPLYRAVSDWLATDWPFRRIRYADR
jgi:hypothetical protein